MIWWPCFFWKYLIFLHNTTTKPRENSKSSPLFLILKRSVWFYLTDDDCLIPDVRCCFKSVSEALKHRKQANRFFTRRQARWRRPRSACKRRSSSFSPRRRPTWTRSTCWRRTSSRTPPSGTRTCCRAPTGRRSSLPFCRVRVNSKMF